MVVAIAGDVGFEVASQSSVGELLNSFDAGAHRYGKTVTKMVGELRSGAVVGPTVLAMRHEDHTAGVCAWYTKPLVSPDRALQDDIYIHTIGLSQDYQGRSLSDGMWLSNALLRGALRQIRAEAPNREMPASWAYVAPFNKKSHRLFAQHGYATRALQPKSDLIRFRPPLDPELLLTG